MADERDYLAEGVAATNAELADVGPPVSEREMRQLELDTQAQRAVKELRHGRRWATVRTLLPAFTILAAVGVALVGTVPKMQLANTVARRVQDSTRAANEKLRAHDRAVIWADMNADARHISAVMDSIYAIGHAYNEIGDKRALEIRYGDITPSAIHDPATYTRASVSWGDVGVDISGWTVEQVVTFDSLPGVPEAVSHCGIENHVGLKVAVTCSY